MNYREYGKTGKKLSLLGFGAMRFPDDREESIGIVLKAVDLGINYFDTAPTYCNSKSEEILGEAFRYLKNENIYISTKSSYNYDKTADDVLRRIDISLNKLGLDKINFFHLWCVMNKKYFEKLLVKGGPYDGTIEAKKRGLVDHIAFSTHASGEEIAEMCDTGLFDGVLLGYNILNFEYRTPAIKAAKRNEMGIVTMNPLGGGLLTKAYDLFDFMDENTENKHIAGALIFNASHKEITCILSGMSSTSEVEKNVKILEDISKPSSEFVKKIKDTYKELGGDFCTDCRYCVPCPEGVNVPVYMRAYDYYKMKRTDLGNNLMKIFRDNDENWKPAENCIECGECEEKCTQHLNIIESLRTAGKVYD